MTAVWPGTVVEEGNLTMQISALRRVLDRGRAQGSCIQTVPGRGYRFVAPVTRADAVTTAAISSPGDGSNAPDAANGQLELRSAECGMDAVLPTPAPRKSYRLQRAVIATVTGALILVAAIAGGLNWHRFLSGEVRPAPRLSIVVLPFVNLGDDRQQQSLPMQSPRT